MSEIKDKIKSALGNKYEIREMIAEGGMGQIYLGVHQSLGKKVAIKIIHQVLSKDTDLKERFYREAKLAAKLDHSGIIDIYDFGSEDDFDYLIMQYIEGITLKDKIEQEGKTELRECLRLMTEVADALAYAHGSGVVHRDIKPANIMIDKQQNVIITDFGISKDLDNSDKSLTGTGMVIGSPLYMSPEQITGGALDGRSDIYSLGIVFYEMVTGRHPFEDKEGIAIYHAHVNEVPPRPAGVPSQVGDIIMKMIEKSPEERYHDGHEILSDLRKYRGQLPRDPKNIDDDITQPVPSRSSNGDTVRGDVSPLPGKGLKKWIIPAGALVLVCILAVAGVMLYPLFKKDMTVSKVPPPVPDPLKTTGTTIASLPPSPPKPTVAANEYPVIPVKPVPLPEPPEPPSFDSVVKKVRELGKKKEAAFLRLWVDKVEFKIGDSVSYYFQSDKDCYLVVFNKTSAGELVQIFPNRFNPDSFVEANKKYSIPGEELDIALEVTGPPGRDEIVALVSDERFDLFSENFDEQPFFEVSKKNQALLEKISGNIKMTEKLDLAQKRITYSIIN